LGEAKSAHILGLATEIMTAVESRFDIKLEIEPVRLGFTDIN
jgi:UDP-N-acetylenolpyruvoylglucosamine reductase